MQGYDDTKNVGLKLDAGIPDISATIRLKFPTGDAGHWDGDGAFSAIKYGSDTNYIGNWSRSGTYYRALAFKASDCNPIYGSSETVQPPAYTVKYFIRALP